jgi:cation:H+ antiporter
MIAALAQFALAALVVVVAGIFLTRYADALADLTGFGRLLIGSILLAGATSLPELVVDISAVRLGAADLAVGDLMGSSLFNLLILAVIDLLHRTRGKMFSHAASAHALSATVSIALAVLCAMGILLRNHLGSVAFLGVGPFPLAIVVGYALGYRMIFLDQRIAATQSESQDVLMPANNTTLRGALLGFGIAATVIVITGPFLAESAEQIAELSGLGRTFVGTTLVALCTSLPELVATLTAVRMGAFDLAAGNIFGSNAFNMVLLLPLDLVHSGSLLVDVSPSHVLTGLATILVTSVAVMGLLYRVEQRKHFVEPDAGLIILLIVMALVGLYYLR